MARRLGSYEVIETLADVMLYRGIPEHVRSDNLTFVAQSGSRARLFAYNSLSQLLSATNPESGTITYTYDNAGNVLTKTTPAPNQTNPAVTVTTTFTYDELNRLKKKVYSDGTTPTVKYSYDGVTYDSCASELSNPTNLAKGRRTAMCDGAGIESWSYDGLGRILTARRTTSSITKDFAYEYYHTGDIWKLTYPSGRTITYQATAGGDTVWAKDVANNVNYATAAAYSPSGTLTSVTVGQTTSFGGIFLNRTFNALHQPKTIQAWSTNGVVLDLAYCFNLNMNLTTSDCTVTPIINNGNVVQIRNNLTSDRTQNFTYDELNRIKTAHTKATTGTNAWGLQFGFDIWANLLSASVTQGSAPMLSVSVNMKNQVTNEGLSYDAAGNLIASGSLSFAYDPESQITAATGVTHTYDGDGNRLKKSNGKLYWYGAGTDVLVESDLSGNLTDEFVYFTGLRIARRKVANGEINFYFPDHLGTSRVVTNATGTVLDDSDFYPFGGERTVTSTSGNTYKFTGKERDAESGMDYFGARYFGSSVGRFLSPDEPLIDQLVEAPQSWNLYTYVRNNPLRFVDPDGQACVSSDGGKTYHDDKSPGQTCKEVDEANKNSKPSVIVTAERSNWFVALHTNLTMSPIPRYVPNDIPLNSRFRRVGEMVGRRTAPLTNALETAGCAATRGALGGGENVIPPSAMHVAFVAAEKGLESERTATLGARAYYTATDGRFKAGGKSSKVLVPNAARVARPILTRAAAALSVVGWGFLAYEVGREGAACAAQTR